MHHYAPCLGGSLFGKYPLSHREWKDPGHAVRIRLLAPQSTMGGGIFRSNSQSIVRSQRCGAALSVCLTHYFFTHCTCLYLCPSVRLPGLPLPSPSPLPSFPAPLLRPSSPPTTPPSSPSSPSSPLLSAPPLLLPCFGPPPPFGGSRLLVLAALLEHVVTPPPPKKNAYSFH